MTNAAAASISLLPELDLFSRNDIMYNVVSKQTELVTPTYFANNTGTTIFDVPVSQTQFLSTNFALRMVFKVVKDKGKDMEPADNVALR